MKDGKKCPACGAINQPGSFGCKSCLSDVAFAEVRQYPDSDFESQQDKMRRSTRLDQSDGSRERAMPLWRFCMHGILTRLKVALKDIRRRNDK